MAIFNGQVVTDKGREILARALSGEGKFIVTKVDMGSGRTFGNIRELTDLINFELNLPIMDVQWVGASSIVTVGVTNKDVETSFRGEEIGIFAKIEGDIEDVLYSYSQASEADVMPDNTLGTTVEFVCDIYTEVSDNIEGTFTINESIAFLTQEIANKKYTITGVEIDGDGDLTTKNDLKANKAYKSVDGGWYKNMGGSRSWNKGNGSPDDLLIPITWNQLQGQKSDTGLILGPDLEGFTGELLKTHMYLASNGKYYWPKSEGVIWSGSPNPSSDLEEVTWKNLKEQLENLSKKTSGSLSQYGSNGNQGSYLEWCSYSTYGDLVTIHIDIVGENIRGKSYNEVLGSLPINLRPNSRKMATINAAGSTNVTDKTATIEFGTNGRITLFTNNMPTAQSWFGTISFIR